MTPSLENSTTPSLQQFENTLTPSVEGIEDNKTPAPKNPFAESMQNISNFKVRDFIEGQVTKVHGFFRGRAYASFEPDTAKLALKLFYSLPLSILEKSLSIHTTAASVGLGTSYIWGRGPYTMDHETRIGVLHSMAIAFFFNAVQPVAEPIDESILRSTFNLALCGLSLAMASSIETDPPKTLIAPENEHDGGSLK